jgi:queuosine precursor transporter
MITQQDLDDMMLTKEKIGVFLAFLATLPIANWMISNVGVTCVPNGPCLIPVGFGLMAPSGVLLIGLALVLRDWLQELTSWRWSAIAVAVGAIISWFTADPFIAVASALAFFAAEILDLAVYTPLRNAGRHIAVLASGVVGAVADSMLFVYIAFGSLDFSIGTALGKIYASVAVALYLYWKVRNATLSRNANNSET